jgi:NDP-sugar pyrophosphorylase family protein
MKALILAAGKGERLRPITETRPKPLIPILCKPLIDWQLRALEKIPGVDEAIVIVSYLKEKIMDYITSNRYKFKIRFIEQGEELGTGDAVLKGVNDLELDEDVLIIYGDIFLKDWSILKKIVSYRENIIVGAEVDDPSKYGVLIMDENNLLRDIVEKPAEPASNIVMSIKAKVV